MAILWHVGSPSQEASRISVSDTCFSLRQALRKKSLYEIKLAVSTKTRTLNT